MPTARTQHGAESTKYRNGLEEYSNIFTSHKDREHADNIQLIVPRMIYRKQTSIDILHPAQENTKKFEYYVRSSSSQKF